MTRQGGCRGLYKTRVTELGGNSPQCSLGIVFSFHYKATQYKARLVFFQRAEIPEKTAEFFFPAALEAKLDLENIMETVLAKGVRRCLWAHMCDWSFALHLLLRKGQALVTVLIIPFPFHYFTSGICLTFRTLVSLAERQTELIIPTSLLCCEHLSHNQKCMCLISVPTSWHVALKATGLSRITSVFMYINKKTGIWRSWIAQDETASTGASHVVRGLKFHPLSLIFSEEEGLKADLTTKDQ